MQEIYTWHLQVPVFAMAWSHELLLAGDWDNRLTIYKPRESLLCGTIPIRAQPTQLINFQSNLIMVDIAGRVTLYNDDRQVLSEITDVNEWIWAGAVSTEGYVALGLDDGTLAVYSLGLKPVYSIFQSTFAIRTELTKMRLRYLGSDLIGDTEFVKPVQGLAVNSQRIAVRFADEVSVYGIERQPGQLELIKLGRFNTDLRPKKFFVFGDNIVLLLEATVRVVNALDGVFQRDYNFSDTIADGAICSTVLGMEGIVAGLEDGTIMQVFVNQRFGHAIAKHDKPIRLIGVSMMHTKIAVVDSERRCCVYDSIGSQLLFIEENVVKFVWNERCDDLIAFSDGDRVSVKPYDLQRIVTKFKGELVRFVGVTIYGIRGTELNEFDVSLAASVKHLARNNDFERAYELAAFGLTEENWNELADSAIRARQLQIAVKAAAHARNTKLLHFIEQISTLVKDSKFTQDHLFAEVDAWTGNFDAAGRVWKSLGDSERAVQMYFDLRQFDKLKQFLSGDRMKKFAFQQAEGFEAMSDLELAADLYIVAGESLRAVNLLITHKRTETLVQISKKIEASESAALKEAGNYLIGNGLIKEGTDLLTQLDDVSSLAKVRVTMKDWDEALSLAKMHPALLPEVFLPFARHLYEDDQYFESLVSFFIAGQTTEAIRALNTLLENAITMHRHEKASFFLYGRSLGLASQSENSEIAASLVISGLHLSRAYSAFGRLREDMASPFSVRERGASFFLSRYVVAYLNSIRRGQFKTRYLHGLSEHLIGGVSFPESLFSLLNESECVGEFRLMKWCAEQLSLFVVPPAVQEVVDFAILRTSGMADGDETESCERCGNRLFSSAEGPLLWCGECKCPIVFSSHSFRVLPVVPVHLKSIQLSDVQIFLKSDPPVENMTVDVGELLSRATAENEDIPVIVPDSFRKLDPASIIICDWKKASKVPPSYFINPGLESIHQCKGCNSLFNDVDFEETFLEVGRCPICKTPLDAEGEGEFADTYDSYSELLKQLRDFAAEIPIHF